MFRVTEFSGELIDSPEGTLEWVPYDEVLQKPSWEGDRIFLEWILGMIRSFLRSLIMKQANM